MEMNKWHTHIPTNEFDYAAIMGALKDYRRPRDKMTTLLRQGEIVRIKKGIYFLDMACGRVLSAVKCWET
jgi:hypothetical protein